MTQSHNTVLRNILRETEKVLDAGQKCLAVFDLDSTLFDVSPRLQQILIEFSQNPQFQKKYPDEVKKVAIARTERTDWGFVKALERAGLDGLHPEFENDLKKFWSERFFSNKYLDYDIPYEGSVDFVQRLYKLGTHVVYLTGRDRPRMGIGTEQILAKWNFPAAELVLKPHQSMNDAQFKSDYFAQLPEDHFEKIWFFENEPLNVNLVRSDHGHVDIIFFDSTHCGEDHPPGDLPRLLHYILED